MSEAATAPRPQEPPQRASLGRRVAGAFVRRRETPILVVLIILVVYFSFSTDAFFGTDNAQVIAEFSAPIAIIAAGEVMLLICGEIDLSAGNVYAFSTWIFYFATTSWGLPLWLAVIVGLLSGSLVGLANGLITVGRRRALVHHHARDDLPPERPDADHLRRLPSRLRQAATRSSEIFGGGKYSPSYWALGVIAVMATCSTGPPGGSVLLPPAVT